MKAFTLLFLFWASGVLANSAFKMEEVFRIPSDSNSPFVFGIIEDVSIDQNGDIYILDTQVKHVVVFSSDGEFLRIIGREGPGPGELTVPGSLVLFGDDGLGIISKRFGRITKIHKVTGEPLGVFRVGGQEKNNTSLGRVRWSNNNFYAVISEAVGDEFLHWRRYIGVFPDSEEDFVIPNVILTDVGWNTGTAREENEYFGIWDPWAVLQSGNAVLSPYWTTYQLEIFDPSGHRLKDVVQPFVQRTRQNREINRYLDLICGGVSPEEIGVEMVLEESEAVIRRVVSREDGTIWVQTSAVADRGAFLEFDSYDPAFENMETVLIFGPGDSFWDQYYFGPNNMLFVIHGGEGFIHTHRGKNEAGFDYDLELVGYKLVEK